MSQFFKMSRQPLFRNPYQSIRSRQRFSNIISDMPLFPEPERLRPPLLARQVTFSEEVLSYPPPEETTMIEDDEEEFEEDPYEILEGLRPEFDEEWFLEGESFGEDPPTHQPSPPQDTQDWNLIVENFKASGLEDYDYEVEDDEAEDAPQIRKRQWIQRKLGSY